MLGQDKATEKNGLEVLDSHKIRKPINKTGAGTYMDAIDWSLLDEIVAALSHDFPSKGDEEITYPSDNTKGLKRLLQAWFVAQLDAIASAAGVDVKSLILGKETLLHFEVKRYDYGTDRKVQVQASSNSNGSLENGNTTGELPLEFLYVLVISEESLHDRKVNAYKLTFDKSKKDNLGDTELFGKLKLGGPVSFYSLKERTSIKGYSSNASSLSWMGTTVSDVFNSRHFLFEIPYISMIIVFW